MKLFRFIKWIAGLVVAVFVFVFTGPLLTIILGMMAGWSMKRSGKGGDQDGVRRVLR